ncbi:LPP20 family lipoprotein [Geovibrio ferrireducens]|jgi:hypothetical protein|uniref:LPP20 family lipoprotein n=1 Tax=Geovibrio ferrireducens TaxID=46201 RepID=UPI00224867A7|nr:LPP20 family lipoprotein [Geovibrio ferrireducens]
MKRIILAVMFVALVTVGCGGKSAEAPKVIDPCFNGAPAWVLSPELEGGLAASGSAKVGPAGMQFAKTEAMASGRDELARIISLKVQNMVKNFTQVTGVGDAQTVDKVSSQVSKQVANETLNGSRQKNIWQSPCGDLWILVVLDPAVVKEQAKQAVQSSYKNDQALWQQFQAKKAYEELDKEIAKEFGQ